MAGTSVIDLANPILTPDSRRISSTRFMSSKFLSSSSIVSAPVKPNLSAATKAQGTLESIRDTSKSPALFMDMVSVGLPVGSNEPVFVPPGSKKSSLIWAPVPLTPGILKLPFTCAKPSFVGIVARIIFFELVLCISIILDVSSALIKPVSIAKGPTAEERLPQLEE